jgi:hypothetical protein
MQPKSTPRGRSPSHDTSGRDISLPAIREAEQIRPVQAVPHVGASWQPREHPAQQPHEYLRGGTTKILTLFHPASGRVRLQPAARGTNAVLHLRCCIPGCASA